LQSMNGITEDAYAAAMVGTSWFRFQEVWLGCVTLTLTLT
jgi:hypothetical protein